MLIERALAAHEAGYEVVACHGKDAFIPGWQNLAVTADMIQSWTSNSHVTNIGIRTGNVIGLDIDVSDAGMSERVKNLALQLLGDTSLVRIGRAPKQLLVYRVAVPFRKKQITGEMNPDTGKPHKVEVLAQGQQFVAYGRHPDTLQPYVWPETDLAAVPARDVPIATEEALQAFLVAAQEIIGSPPKPRQVPSPGPAAYVNGHRDEPTDAAEAIDALQSIPGDLDYDEWIRVGFALHAALGSGGYAHWCTWSAKSSKNVPTTTSKKWPSFAQHREINPETLFWIAMEHGWKPARSAQGPAVADLRIFKTMSQNAASDDVAKRDIPLPRHDPETGEILEEEPSKGKAPTEGDLLEGSDTVRWIGQPVPKIEFVVSEFIPDLCATLLAGDGGSGKSILLQTMATCIAMGIPFLGREVIVGRALYITAEDHEDIVHARQARINAALGIEMDALAGKLFVMSTTERDFTLFSGKETKLARKLRSAIIGRGMRFVGIDSASLTYDDDEINRRAVSAFMRLLNDIAREAAAALVLICHTSKSSDGTSARMASGSTAWVNGARSGILLKAEQGGAELTLLKTNHSKPGTKVSLYWTDDGVLLADMPATGTVANIEKSNEERMLLAEITSAWQDPSTSPLSGAPQMKERYLPTFMTRKHGWQTRRTGEVLARLFDTNKVSTGEVRKNGKRQVGICPIFT